MKPSPVESEPPLTAKAVATRARILETAIRLFQERGYDATTMRDLAGEAGVSLGNAYYYFPSKEHLVQAFYRRTHEEHLTACDDLLEREPGLEARLRGVLRAKVATLAPYHRIAGALFKTAADPRSPIHPLSAESAPLRGDATALLARVLDGARLRIPADLRAELPRLLWLYHMGIVLFWIHDRSSGQARTQRLIDRTVEIVARLIALASHPLLRPLRKSTHALLAELNELGGLE